MQEFLHLVKYPSTKHSLLTNTYAFSIANLRFELKQCLLRCIKIFECFVVMFENENSKAKIS